MRKKPGRPPTWERRQLIDGIRSRIRTGIPWRDTPPEYGPWGRVLPLVPVEIRIDAQVHRQVERVEPGRGTGHRPPAPHIQDRVGADQVPTHAEASAVGKGTGTARLRLPGARAAEDPDRETRIAVDFPLPQSLDEYVQQSSHYRELVAASGLDDQAKRAVRDGLHVDLRWILLHLTEETARHNGHLDILREMLDGTTGD
ncbi:DUF664 domain-containing protein [Streptomyces sp. NPDC048636]|uniref:mycothiol transferase n=1 Tax=Streptomyces sp. NPDC048636 TaxID=3155762 RepID=UPI00341A5ACE